VTGEDTPLLHEHPGAAHGQVIFGINAPFEIELAVGDDFVQRIGKRN
jgi:hypothetical protein